MDASAFVDGEDEPEHRLDIVSTIISKLSKQRWIRPTPSQENSYEVALGHIARICSKNKDTPLEGSFSCCNLKNCSRSTSRKECLREVLTLLRSMERKRLYDPPADDEIQYYILIKRYIRSLITFFDASVVKPGPSAYLHEMEYRSTYCELSSLLETVELSWHVSDFSTNYSDMDISKGSSINPWMSMKDDAEIELDVIHGSKERNNMFYYHKFRLARFDLCSTEFAFCYASADEKGSYLRVSDSLPVVNLYDIPEVNPNVYSDELNYLFRERIHREAGNLVRHFRRIESATFQKLSISDHWKYISKEKTSYLDEPDLGNWADLGKELAQKYHVSDENLPGYITLVDQCLFVASYMHTLIFSPCHHFFMEVTQAIHLKPSDSYREVIGWEALYAATFLRHGSLSNRSLFQNKPWQQMVPKEVLTSREQALHEAKMKCNHASPEDRMGTSSSVKILKEIIEKIKIIGCKDVQVQLDEEERRIMIKIWTNVASAASFFFSAMTYEQRQFFMEHNIVPSSMRGLIRKTKKRKKFGNDEFESELSKARRDGKRLFCILAWYKYYMLKRLKNKQEMNLVLIKL